MQVSLLVPFLFCQALGLSTFQHYVDVARARFGLPPLETVTSSERPWAAWVLVGPHGFSQDIVYVRPDFLRSSDPWTMEVVAAHECCHLYMGADRNKDLDHLMIDGCVEWVLGPRYDRVMQAIPCGDWYPSEAARYHLKRGRRKCVEKR